MLKIQYISDLHLERTDNNIYFSENPIEKIGDILILAGDVTKITKLHYKDSFFDDISEKFDQVFMIPGNHEYYDIQELNLINEPFINRKIRHNVTLLNNQNIVYKGINFIFSTMWTPISPDKAIHIQLEIADYKHIKTGKNLFLPDDSTRLFNKSFAFIEKCVKENTEEKVFVVTHHAPTNQVKPYWRKTSAIGDAFNVELHSFIYDNKIDYWLYGHTHDNIDVEINGTKIISNQFGYAEFRGSEFKQKIVEL